jgi:hypothetical protein
VYVVALIERYETLVLASSRQAAIDAVDHHGGADPVWHKVTAQPAKDQNLDNPDIEGA